MRRVTFVIACACAVIGFAAGAWAGSPDRKVLFVGIDGCRYDAVEKADAPNLKRLAAEGILSRSTSILGPRPTANDTVSGPGWSSIYTGVWADKHGVVDNTFKGSRYDRFPHFFARLREARPDAVTASFSDWTPIEGKIVSAATVSKCPIGDDEHGVDAYVAADERVAAEAADYLKNGAPTAVCVYFGQVDEAGHAKGFHPTVPEYVAAIERVDGHVGRLLRSLAARPNAANEEWLVLVTTDHGGQGTGHGKGHDVEAIRRTFLIANGKGIVDPGPERQTYFVDVVPTALAWLGVAIKPEWELDGTPFGIKEVRTEE